MLQESKINYGLQIILDLEIDEHGLEHIKNKRALQTSGLESNPTTSAVCLD